MVGVCSNHQLIGRLQIWLSQALKIYFNKLTIMKFWIIYFLLFCFTILYFACTQKNVATNIDEEKFMRCEFPENNLLDLFIWYVPKGENCCAGKGSQGAHETWKLDEGNTRSFVKSVSVDAGELQKRFCKEN